MYAENRLRERASSWKTPELSNNDINLFGQGLSTDSHALGTGELFW